MARIVFIAGLLLLAAPPASWLVHSWFDGGYGSDGEWVFLLAAAIVLRAVSSRRSSREDPRRAVMLFTATALVRFLGELAAIHVVGAFALVIDVYALALALGVHRRARAVSPAGVAALLGLSLPIERLIQRGLGFPLQLLSTRLACGALTAIHPSVVCEGVLVRTEGSTLSIDLPCSGARGLVLLLVLALALIALRRVRGRRIPLVMGIAVAGALAANTLRVFLLVEGVLAGLAVLSEPLHSLLGLACLALASAGILALIEPEEHSAPAAADPPARRFTVSPVLAGAVLTASLAIHLVPARPLDVSGPVAPIALPRALGGWLGEDLALTEPESEYFTEFGGAARKMHYTELAGGVDFTVIAVRTRAPLRHLHAEECLVGAGHHVERLGISAGGLPTAVYRSTDRSGHVHRVEISFVSERGERATSVAEVAWLWMRAPKTEWTMLERITDWNACERDAGSCAGMADALVRTLLPEVTHADLYPSALAVDHRLLRR